MEINVYATRINIEHVDRLPETAYANMTPERKARALRSRRIEARERILATGLLEGYVLSKELHIPANELDIRKNTEGCPELTAYGDGHFYNISHAGEYVVLVYSDFRVGIDLEEDKRYSKKVTDRFFTEAENKLLQSLPEAVQNREFVKQWTMKESFMKYCGLGFKIPVTQIETEWENGYGRIAYPENVSEEIKAEFDRLELTPKHMPVCKLVDFFEDYGLMLCLPETKKDAKVNLRILSIEDLFAPHDL